MFWFMLIVFLVAAGAAAGAAYVVTTNPTAQATATPTVTVPIPTVVPTVTPSPFINALFYDTFSPASDGDAFAGSTGAESHTPDKGERWQPFYPVSTLASPLSNPSYPVTLTPYSILPFPAPQIYLSSAPTSTLMTGYSGFFNYYPSNNPFHCAIGQFAPGGYNAARDTLYLIIRFSLTIGAYDSSTVVGIECGLAGNLPTTSPLGYPCLVGTHMTYNPNVNGGKLSCNMLGANALGTFVGPIAQGTHGIPVSTQSGVFLLLMTLDPHGTATYVVTTDQESITNVAQPMATQITAATCPLDANGCPINSVFISFTASNWNQGFRVHSPVVCRTTAPQ